MVATVTTRRETQTSPTQPVSPTARWRQVNRFSTVESAEQQVADLQSQGIDAVLSMIDGLCVLVPNPRQNV